MVGFKRSLPGISTHDLTRRSTIDPDNVKHERLFQLTTSQGGRPSADITPRVHVVISTHDLTRRSTLRSNKPRYVRDISTHDLTRRSTGSRGLYISISLNFNSRPHKEVDVICSNIIIGDVYFNSRPHKEVDDMWTIWSYLILIFQLTTSQGGRRNA